MNCNRSFIRLMLACVLASAAATLAYAQGGATSSLSGVVVDTGGGVVPGATVVVKNTATGSQFETISNTDGLFSVPAIAAGTYSVTVSLSGFKTAVINDLRVSIGQPVSVKATLEVGNLEETIVVQSSSDIVNTQTATISSTLNVDQINKMPMPTRNALNAVTFLPGVNTAGINRDSNFNGLPDSFVAITLDGVNNNDNFNKSTEGLFAMVTPRQDAIEAVTVTTAVGGADVGGHGAVSINFATRSGTNRFAGSAYEYFRAPELNTNYFFNELSNLPTNDVKLNQYGFRQGGPIVLPGLYNGRGKAFFFFNYEELRLPNNVTRTRTVLNADAQRGIFRWEGANGQVLERDVLALAAGAGFVATPDPLTARILGEIRSAMGTTGVVQPTTDRNTQSYVWQSPGNQVEKQPVARLDYNLTDNHRISGVYNWQVVTRDPDHLNGDDVRFPGLTNYARYVSYRPFTSGTLRSTLSSNIVNELRGGIRWGPGYFGKEDSSGAQTFSGADGFALDLSNNNDLNLTNWHQQNGLNWRSAWSWNVDNTLNWQRGKHSMSFGTSLFFGNVWENAQTVVPGITFDMAANDPATALFSQANFPGASTAALGDAQDLFALLTGRVNSYTSQAVLGEASGKYELLGTRRRAGRMNEFGVFAQDSWRITPTFTLNAGLRWDLQTPFTPVNDILSQSTFADACGVSGIGANGDCNFYDPQAAGGRTPEFVAFGTGSTNYNTDWNNFAPNVGVAWRPNVQDGWLRGLLGDPEQATVRAGYSHAYDRQGMGVFTGQYGANPGSTLSLERSEANGLLVPAGTGQTWPLLLRDRARLPEPAPCPAGVINAGCVPETVTYPIPVRSNRADSVNTFHPDIKIAYARSWTVSFQRALTRGTAIDIRYVGTRGVNQWTEINYNADEDRNIIDNGFFDEFQRAMGNLQANNAAGGSRAGSFKYFGPGSGTSPLPIYLAYFNASRDTGNPDAYAGANWTNTTFAGRLNRHNPDPINAAEDLDTNQTRRDNAARAGLTPNFFVVNPAVNQSNVYESEAYSDYHALQVELRRRLSGGLQVNGSYQYAIEGGSSYQGRRYGRVMNPTANVRHAIKMQWDYSLPVGRGRRFGGDMNRFAESVLGGWEFSGAGRVQARTVNFGNVQLVGMTVDELTDAYKWEVRPNPTSGAQTVYYLPQDIIDNTRRAFSLSTTSANGYSSLGAPEGRYFTPANSVDCIQLRAGDCAPRTLLVRQPFFTRFDIGLTKRFPIRNQVNFELRFDVLNVFDNVNFLPHSTAANNSPGSGANIFTTDQSYRDFNNQFDPGGRLGQIVVRLNW
jgi:Carboxypeptidase regulatory-like domain/TonB dependent receptor